MDILGPIRGEHATSYVIVLMDLYSRWVEVSCVQDISSSAVIRFLEGVFKRESFPRYLLTDNGVHICRGVELYTKNRLFITLRRMVL